MKKFLLNVMLVVAGMIFSHNLFAQFPIPSFNVPVVLDPTIFEEQELSANLAFNSLSQSDTIPANRGELKLKIITRDQNVLFNAWVLAEVYSLNGNVMYGPFLIYENDLFELSISADELWGVRVIDASEGSKMDVWIE